MPPEICGSIWSTWMLPIKKNSNKHCATLNEYRRQVTLYSTQAGTGSGSTPHWHPHPRNVTWQRGVHIFCLRSTVRVRLCLRECLICRRQVTNANTNAMSYHPSHSLSSDLPRALFSVETFCKSHDFSLASGHECLHYLLLPSASASQALYMEFLGIWGHLQSSVHSVQIWGHSVQIIFLV